jgi:hypothetical protein
VPRSIQPAAAACQPEDGKDLEAHPAGARNTRPVASTEHERSIRADASALDFWVGDWVCTWEGGHGTNRITKELDERVVVERFESLEPERWTGMSVSVHHDRLGWRQTWVDSTGNYWALHGEEHPEGFAFAVGEREDGHEVLKRMVFSDIQAERFDWRWERSDDGGGTWSILWRIDYRRASPSS